MTGNYGGGLLSNTLRGLLGSDEAEKLAVWAKGKPIAGFDPGTWRRDRFGSVMKFSDYGLQTQYGWEKDHSMPSALGGSSALANLHPLHWQNNRAKGTRIV